MVCTVSLLVMAHFKGMYMYVGVGVDVLSTYVRMYDIHYTKVTYVLLQYSSTLQGDACTCTSLDHLDVVEYHHLLCPALHGLTILNPLPSPDTCVSWTLIHSPHPRINPMTHTHRGIVYTLSYNVHVGLCTLYSHHTETNWHSYQQELCEKILGSRGPSLGQQWFLNFFRTLTID